MAILNAIPSSRAFMWRPETRNDGISIPWTSVSLHAIASEPRSIYMQLDFRLSPWPGVYDGPNPPAQPNGNGHAMEADEGNAGEEDEDEGNVSGGLVYSSNSDQGFTQKFFSRFIGRCWIYGDSHNTSG